MTRSRRKLTNSTAVNNTNPLPALTRPSARRILTRRIGPLERLTKMMEGYINTVDSKLDQIGKRVDAISSGSSNSTDNHTSQTEDIQSPAMVVADVVPVITSPPYHSWPQVQTDRPRYPSKIKHPVNFIEDLTAYLKKIPHAGENTIELIIECLDGEIRDWARIYRDRWSKLEDFKRDFFDTYWGEAEQNQLRRIIVHNTWDSAKTTMLQHFISLCGQAKMLTYRIPDNQLVNDIMRHFPKDVQYAWSCNKNTTILDATEFLRKLDDINKPDNNVNTKPTQAAPQDKQTVQRESNVPRRKNQYNNYATQPSARMLTTNNDVQFIPARNNLN